MHGYSCGSAEEETWAFLRTSALWHWFFHAPSFRPWTVSSSILIIYTVFIIAAMIRILCCCVVPKEHEKEERKPNDVSKIMTLSGEGKR